MKKYMSRKYLDSSQAAPADVVDTEDSPQMPAPHQIPIDNRPMCRNFARRECSRSAQDCKYRHEIIFSEMPLVYTFCWDFQNKRCTRTDCKHVHADVFQQQHFYRTGYLPPSVLQRSPKRPKPSEPYECLTEEHSNFAILYNSGQQTAKSEPSRNNNQTSQQPTAVTGGTQSSNLFSSTLGANTTPRPQQHHNILHQQFPRSVSPGWAPSLVPSSTGRFQLNYLHLLGAQQQRMVSPPQPRMEAPPLPLEPYTLPPPPPDSETQVVTSQSSEFPRIVPPPQHQEPQIRHWHLGQHARRIVRHTYPHRPQSSHLPRPGPSRHNLNIRIMPVCPEHASTSGHANDVMMQEKKDEMIDYLNRNNILIENMMNKVTCLRGLLGIMYAYNDRLTDQQRNEIMEYISKGKDLYEDTF